MSLKSLCGGMAVKIIALVCTGLLVAIMPGQALQAAEPVNISEDYSTIAYSGTYQIDPKKPALFPLPSNSLGDHYELRLSVGTSSIRMVTFDVKSVEKTPKPRAISDEVITGEQQRRIEPGKQRDVVIALSSASPDTSNVALTIFRVGKRSEKMREGLRPSVQIVMDTLDTVYQLPKFQVYVKPCGKVNAFSSPDITICTELIGDLADKGLERAIPMAVLHEMGHTLLKLWGLPGWDNEDMADEFAASILAKGFPDALKAWSTWLRKLDSTQAAAYQLEKGDKHTIPIQRARNIEAILKNPSPVMARWSVMLAQYTKPLPSELAERFRKDMKLQSHLAAVEGVCDSLVAGGINKTTQCGSAMLLLKPGNGRHSFLVQTLDRRPITFSGGTFSVTEERFIVMQVDEVAVISSESEPPKFIPARGKCLIYGTPSVARDIQCDAIGGADDGAFNVRFKPTTPWKMMLGT